MSIQKQTIEKFLQIDNVLIQVRSLLQAKGIKLWLEPYYYEDIGLIESEIEKLAQEFNHELGITIEDCKTALSELQDGAVKKLETRKEFEKTGIATLKIKILRPHDSSNFITIKCPLTDIGKQLQEKLSQQIEIDQNKLKIIFAGKVLQSELSLKEQKITNNQQLMAIIASNSNDSDDNNASAINDRVRQAKEDAEMILKSKNQNFFRMEDQDGNAVYLPPNEKKSIIMALALYEKGRVLMKRSEYTEALVLYLEADEEFSSCNSAILDTVDNYALLNLDIVWCYLCLKSFTQLPDAERRLKICQESFQRSYGRNLDRVVALKGNSQNERALIMRLHLLQGILLFYQNQRNEAYEKLLKAENELKSLQIDDEKLLLLLEMGYNITESRIALRSCYNDIEKAINFIIERRQCKKQARDKNTKEDQINNELEMFNASHNNKWVNPRSLNTLINMGFSKEMAFIALKMSDNDIQMAIDLLHNNRQEIMNEMSKSTFKVEDDLINKIVQLGFDPDIARIALETAYNNSEEAIELLRKMQNDTNLKPLLNSLNNIKNQDNNIVQNNDETFSTIQQPGPSSSSFSNNTTTNENKTDAIVEIQNRIKNEMEVLKAYERFSEDIKTEDDEYLDLPLIQEKQILYEYKRLLE